MKRYLESYIKAIQSQRSKRHVEMYLCIVVSKNKSHLKVHLRVLAEPNIPDISQPLMPFCES